MQSILQNIGPLGLLVLGFGFVIFVHELGHFLVAKFVGIKVTQFALGFGPALLAWRQGVGLRLGSTEPEVLRRVGAYFAQRGEAPAGPAEAAEVKNDGKSQAQAAPPPANWSSEQLDRAAAALGISETEYRLNYLPLGGYVKMLGQEDMDPTATSLDPRAFNRKPAWARAGVISAGVVMNLIWGVVFFIVAFMYGITFPPAVVGGVVPDSPAAVTFAQSHEGDPLYQGLRPTDRILSLDGKRADDFTDVMMAAALGSPDEPVQVVVQRDGRELTFPIAPKKSKETGLLAFGIEMQMSTALWGTEVISPEQFRKIAPNLAAAGVEPGMKVVKAGDQPVERHDQMVAAIVAARGLPVPVTYANADKSAVIQVRAVPRLMDGGEEPNHLLGLTMAMSVAQTVEGGPAQKAGMREGDLVAAVDGTPWPDLPTLQRALAAGRGREMRITVWREGQAVDLPPIKPAHQKDGRYLLNFAPQAGVPRLCRVLPSAPAELAALNLPPGTRITSVNGQAIETVADMQRLLQEAAGDGQKAVQVTLGYRLMVKDEPAHQLVVTLDAATARAVRHLRWDVPRTELGPFEQVRHRVNADTPWAATMLGVKKTHQFMVQTYLTLLRLFQGNVPVNQLRGPLGIAEAGTDITREHGWPYLLFFLGLISVNLVVINFLPMPIVDGGLMVFLIIEKLKGSPVSPRVLNAANWVGLGLIGTIFITVTWFDISRLAGRLLGV